MEAEDHWKKRGAAFGAGAEAYERARPGYPDAAVDWLVSAGARQVLDLAAGTGKLTRLLAARGLSVTAVDPSQAMLDQLGAKLPTVTRLQGSAEAIPCADATFDAVLVAQAWHWFEPAKATAEIVRVLRPGGRLGLVWNTRDESVQWVRRLTSIIDRGQKAYGSTTVDRLDPPFDALEAQTFRWAYRLGEAGLTDLVASRSAFLTLPDADRSALLDDVRALFREVASARDGDASHLSVELPYTTRCYRATRR